MNDKLLRKLNRKIKHCEGVLLKYENIRPSEKPTRTIFIGNGGLGCGIQSEQLMEIFSIHGPVQSILMIPDKPYSFVVYKYLDAAVNGFDMINGQNMKSGHMFYLSYINDEDLPNQSATSNLWPKGLICIENFISEDEEKDFLSYINFEESDGNTTLKHRKVKHYGYEFLYGKNNIDKAKPLDAKIPDLLLPLLRKLVSLGHISRMPDQLTVNRYLPGQGIPPHVDTHSAFEDGIISISLGSQVVMDFYHPSKQNVPVLVPRRSALIMKDESRYLWKHGITPRKTDVIHIGTEETPLTLSHRETRTSLTFRLVRQGKCNCGFPEQCDSQVNVNFPKDLVNENEAEELERKFVSQVYENIADHFSDTRYKPWPKVCSFLSSVSPGSLILDVGCGNGKNMGLSKDCFEIGCDASSKLTEVCSNRNVQVLVADCLKLPFRNDCVDVIICIAVIHHLSTKGRRSQAVKEIIRVLGSGGKALIYVWAFEQETAEGPSNYLKLTKLSLEAQKRNGEEPAEILLTDNCSSPKVIQMPVHKNRTNFMQQDMLVPWKEKKEVSSDKENTTHHRYYHVFTEGELEKLVIENNGHILSSYYDKGNWCVLIQK